MVVLDSSALVALLVDSGELGEWVSSAVDGSTITGPQLLPFEVANILRRQQLAEAIDHTTATLAHADLVALPLKLWPHTLLADRVWALRDRVTAYDASYLALAELVGGPVITLDRRLGHTHGLPCPVLLPPARLLSDAEA
jgi:predicted nucleic acid-binding protein